MEVTATEKLKYYGSVRGHALDTMFRYTPKYILSYNSVFHSVILISTGSLIAAIFATTRKLSLFSLHPTCMTLGAILFFGEGVVSYRNGTLLEMLSPIMQRDRKSKMRAIHQTLQMVGALFFALGMLFIFAHKIKYDKSIVPSSFHSIIGSVVLLLISVQIVSGKDKVNQLESSNKRVRRWHEDLGLLLWDMICLTVVLGVLSFLSLSIATCIVGLTVLVVWLAVHAQMLTRASLHKYDSSNSMDDCPVAGFSVGSLGPEHNNSFGNIDLEASTESINDTDRLIEDHDTKSGEVTRKMDS